MRVALPFPHYTAADVWTMLPPSRRQPAQDYCDAGRVRERFRIGTALIGRVAGYRDDHVAYAARSADAWEVSCSCAATAPCAHVGALLLEAARRPDQFLPWPPSPWSVDEATVLWARQQAFPWAAWQTRATSPPWQAGAEDPGLAAALSRIPASRRSSTLRDWLSTLPERFWDDPTFVADLTRALADLGSQSLPSTEIHAWIGLMAQHPDLPIAPLIMARPGDPLVESRLLELLYQGAAQFLMAPRPSLTVVGQTLLGRLADWLLISERGDEAAAVWTRFPYADPTGLTRGDWLYRHGRIEDARTCWTAIVPHSPGQAAELAARLSLVEAAGAPTPASE